MRRVKHVLSIITRDREKRDRLHGIIQSSDPVRGRMHVRKRSTDRAQKRKPPMKIIKKDKKTIMGVRQGIIRKGKEGEIVTYT